MPPLDWKPISSLPSQRRRIFLDELGKRDPAAVQYLRRHEPLLEALDAACDENGYWAARATLPDGKRMLVPTDRLQERCEAQAGALKKAVQGGARLVVISGIGVGYLCQTLEPYLAGKTGFLIVEDDPLRVLVASTLYELNLPAQSLNVLWAIGVDVQEKILRLSRDDCLFLLPLDRIEYVLGAMPTAAQEAEHYSGLVGGLPKLFEPELRKFDGAVEHFLARSVKPPKFPGLAWTYHHPRAFIHLPLLRSLMSGFEAHGWNTRCDLAGDDFASSFRLASSIVHSVPDLYVFLNGPSRAYLTNAGINAAAERDIARPRLSWIVDDMSLSGSTELRSGYTTRDYVFCADRTYMESFRDCGAKVIAHLPAGPTVSAQGEQRSKYAAPISFVGSIHNTASYLDRLSSKAQEWVSESLSLKLHDRRVSFQQIVENCPLSSRDRDELQHVAESFHATTSKGVTDAKQILAYFLYVITNHLYRQRVVESLLPLGLRVFGPETWLDVLPSEYKDRCGGFVPYEEAGDAYASAEISLNLHSFQCPTCLNARDFNVVMAGGCLLADWVEDFDRDYFDSKSEVALFRTEEEAVDTARDLLSDSDRREAMKSAAHARLLREHTVCHRVEKILNILSSPDSDVS